MARDIIIVGAGNYWFNLVQPALPKLKSANLVNRITTIDITEQSPIEGTTHFIRQKEQPLSKVLDKIDYENPFVILSHANNLHTSDAVEVMENAKSKPKLLIEKPYSTNNHELTELEELLKNEEGNIGLLEYYLTMKGIPLLIFGGAVKEESFYFTDKSTIKELTPNALIEQNGKIREMIGQPIHIISETLEGEGSYGTIEHRNLSLVDRTLGGGMIQDLGQHSLTPLMALEDYLGRIDSSSLKELKVAFCKEYTDFAKSKGIPEDRIGESYAELKFVSSKKIPVDVCLGKYVEKGNNQRRIIILGTRGTVIYDMTNNILAYQHKDDNKNVKPLLEAEKKGAKYLAVLRAGIEYIEGRNPFFFNPAKVAFEAQKIILSSLDFSPAQKAEYDQGEMHDEIFR